MQVDLRSGKGFFGDAEGDASSGFESVIGTFRNDALFGSDLGDRLDGGAGTDAILARGGNDIIVGGAGADILDRGDGVDTVDYAASKQGIKASLLTGLGFVGDDALGDTYTGIENLTGSAFDDELEGDRFANALSGGAGDDTLFGGAGRGRPQRREWQSRQLDYRSASAFIQVDLGERQGLLQRCRGRQGLGLFEIVVGSAHRR